MTTLEPVIALGAADVATPLLAAAFVWWIGAGLVLFTERAVPRMGGARFLIAGLMLGGALMAFAASLDDPTPTGAYVAFIAGVGVWAWHEVAFLSGWLTGPQRAPCPPGARGWRRFRLAAGTLIHHELALAATLAAMLLAAEGAANKTAVATFAVLWVMRLSAKLNLFLGVPNVSAGALPEPIAHMRSYFRRSGVTYLFPLSVTAATVGAACLTRAAFVETAGPFETTAALLVAGLLLLAALEHWFMALPIQDTLFWRWAFGDPPTAPATGPAATKPIDATPRATQN